MAELQHWETDKALYLFTSLTAGSSHIVTATSRVETILKNARIPFTYIDTATNESAKKLFQRRARGKKLPLLVKEGFVIADLEEVEEYNEFGELEEVIGEVSTTSTSISTTPAKMGLAREGGTPSKPTPVTSEATPANEAASASATQEEMKKESKPQQSSVIGQLAQEAAAKAKQVAKKVPTPLASKTNTMISPTEEKEEPKENDTPSAVKSPTTTESALKSPSGVPLPKSQAVRSPTTSESPVKSPTSAKSPTISHRRHSSTGSVHSFIPEKSGPEVREHRGSELSAASEEEIRKIESECSIAEEDEEEMDEATEDAILFGDADGDDEPEKQKEEEKTLTKKTTGRASVSEPVLTPVTEEKLANAEEEASAPKPLNIKGEPAKVQVVSKSAGLTLKEPDNAAKSDEEDEDEGEDEDSSSEDEEEVGNEKANAASLSPAKDSLSSPKSAPAAVASGTTLVDTKLANAVDNVKIQDQEPAEAKQASVSIED